MWVRMSMAVVFLLLCVRADFTSAGSLNAPQGEKVLRPDGTGTGTSSLRGKKRKKVDEILQKCVFESAEMKQHVEGSKENETRLRLMLGCGVAMAT